jgi:hypothetical protein
MFALPQVLKGDDTNETKDRLPVVQVTEEKETLERLLLMCYPMATVDPPALKVLEDVHALLEAAIKYNMERVEGRVRGWLVAPSFLATNPVRVFAIACRHKLLEEAKIAARSTLSQPILDRPYGPELEFMTAGTFYHLLQYHRKCVEAARDAATRFPRTNSNDSIWDKCSYCKQSGRGSQRHYYDEGGSAKANAPWFSAYLQSVTGASTCRILDDKKQDQLMEAALKEGLECNGCRSKVFTDLRTFNTMLKARMNEAISAVSNDALYIQSLPLRSKHPLVARLSWSSSFDFTKCKKRDSKSVGSDQNTIT